MRNKDLEFLSAFHSPSFILHFFFPLAAAVCLSFCGCAAIEIDKNPQPVRIRVEPKESRGTNDRTTETLTLPRYGPEPTAKDLAPTSGTLNVTMERALVLAVTNNRA